MSDLDRTKIQKPNFGRPHVVILGAGASLAAFPNGDKNGRKLPLMNNIIEVVGLSGLMDSFGITEYHDNFEKLYSNLVLSKKHPELVKKIDQIIFDYFSEMQIPDEPTLYDHLVLSLREKDVIATFNWDPFLVQALARNKRIAPSPHSLFLHGNSAIGHCTKHRPITIGLRGGRCNRCGEALADSRLLFPVTQKKYNADPFINKSWEMLEKSLSDAYLVTIFGYSAPETDIEAIEIFKRGWGIPAQRELEETEMIDLKDEDALVRTWNFFINSHHYQTTNNFYNSIISKYPRRSCEAMWDQLMEVIFIGENPIPEQATWDELSAFYTILTNDENNFNSPN